MIQKCQACNLCCCCLFYWCSFIIPDDEQSISEYTVRRRTNLSRSDSMDVHSPRNSYNGDIAEYTPVHVNIIITMLIFTWEVRISQGL